MILDIHTYLTQVTNVATANYGMLTAPFNQELSTATLQNSLNSDNKFTLVVPSPATLIFDSSCTTQISCDWNILHTYSAEWALDITTTHCGMLTMLAKGNTCILFHSHRWKDRIALKSYCHVMDTAVGNFQSIIYEYWSSNLHLSFLSMSKWDSWFCRWSTRLQGVFFNII